MSGNCSETGTRISKTIQEYFENKLKFMGLRLRWKLIQIKSTPKYFLCTFTGIGMFYNQLLC
jgi:hypothetical protein